MRFLYPYRYICTLESKLEQQRRRTSELETRNPYDIMPAIKAWKSEDITTSKLIECIDAWLLNGRSYLDYREWEEYPSENPANLRNDNASSTTSHDEL